MQVYAHRVAPFDNGMYVIADARGDAILIDPSQGEREALATLRERGLRVVELINTHGHPDHIFANAALQAATGARLAIHRADAYRLDPKSAPQPRIIGEFPRSTADDLIEEGPLTYLADLELQALHTPGHTEGSTSFYLPAEGMLFSGDVLFAGNVGRVDLPGADTAAMERSLARLADLPPETTVYPGHGPATTIGAELRWLRGFRFR
ncbi:MAG TPA: MBL fold metallo-hydrolase [Candidatus Saccharimonadales bacterium]|nr:MBL fold metallo-hydrolase [Candidatus Saccharimonadales bacterium]